VVRIGRLTIYSGLIGVEIQTTQIENKTLTTCLRHSHSLAGTPVWPA
jgi:hypothetical protein